MITGNDIKIPYSQISNLHKRLAKKHGKASKCENENCKSSNPKRFEWALKKGKVYSDNVEDYMQLCPSCHRLYDYTDEQKLKQSLAKRGIPKTGKQRNFIYIGIQASKKPIIQLSKDGNILNQFESVTQASKITGIGQSSISSNLTNIYKTSGGYIWKYKN